MTFKVIPVCSALVVVLLGGCTRDPLSIRQRCITNGDKYYEKGKYQQASLLYRRALQVDARSADAWYRLGLTNLKLGNARGAVQSLQRAVELNPDNDDAAVRLAELYAQAGLNADSNTHRELMVRQLTPLVARLLEKNPASYDALRLDGYLALIKRDRNLAIERLRSANEVKPWEPPVVSALAELLAAGGHSEDAARLGEDLLARHKDYEPMYRFLYELYLRASKFDRADDILKRRIQNVPDDGRGRILLALNYYLTRRNREMLAVLQTLRDDRKKLPAADGLIGDFDLLVGDLNGAVQAYRDAEKYNPADKSFYEIKAIEALAVQGKTGEAIDAADRLYQAAPKDAEIAAFRAVLRSQADPGELRSSIASLESLAAQNPRNALVHFCLGRAYRQKGDAQSLRNAGVHLETAIALRPELIPAKALLAQVRLLENDGRRSIQAADDVLRRDPSNLGARITRAMAYSLVQEPDKARQDLLVALAMHKNSTEAELRLASLDLSEKRYAEAQKEFHAVAAAGDPRGYVGLARIQTAQGQVAKAAELLRTQCARFPESRDCVSELASFHLRAGRLDEAKSAFERLTKIEPQVAVHLTDLADVEFRMGDAQGAMASFRKARELDPGNERAALGVAVLLDAAGRKEQAAAAYEDTLRIDSSNAQALNNLAYLKAERGADLDRAMALAEKAVQQSPENSNYIDTLGYVYCRRGLAAQSIGVLQPLVKKHPDNASYHLHLAMALYAGKKPDMADKELRLAMRHRPSAEEQRQIEELTAKLR